jgi:hypothetical protein
VLRLADKRVSFRFSVPLLNSEYSLQSSTFYGLQWPTEVDERKNCSGCPNGNEKYCDARCSGAPHNPCTPGYGRKNNHPNLVNFLPEKYLFAYKHKRLEDCHQHSDNSTTCQPTALAMGNSKGRLVDSWQVMVPVDMQWTGHDVQDFCDEREDSQARWTPYFGSLTGVARTPHATYACGRPDLNESTPWFLFRFRPLIDDSPPFMGNTSNIAFQANAYIEQAIPLRWLGTMKAMTVERCLLAYQPGWGGRGSANVGDMARLWVAPTASGLDKWMATARGCHVPLVEGCTYPYFYNYQENRAKCNKVKAGRHHSEEGYLKDPRCFLTHIDGRGGVVPAWSDSQLGAATVRNGWDLQLEGFAASFRHRANHLVIGPGVNGLSFFDNKMEESHVAVGRCDPGIGHLARSVHPTNLHAC